MIEESRLVAVLERTGREIPGIKSWEIDSDYLTPTDGFSFTTYSSDVSLIEDLEMQPVRLSVSGADQLIGRIDKSTVGIDSEGSAIRYDGRDYIADFIEDNIDPGLTFKEGLNLGELVRQCFAPHGVTTVSSETDVLSRNVRTGKSTGAPPIPNFETLKVNDLKPEAGTGAYEFVHGIVARFGCTVQPSLRRDTVLLSKPNYNQPVSYRLTRRKAQGAKNNIVSATRTRDFSRVPSFVFFTGSQARSGEQSTALSRQIDVPPSVRVVSPSLGDVLESAMWRGRYSDRISRGQRRETARLYRSLNHRDSKAKSTEQLESAMFRAFYERLRESFSYEVTVQGHVSADTGAVWTVDTLVEVHDEVARVFETLWVARRKLSFDETSGATTTLTCWQPKLFLP